MMKKVVYIFLFFFSLYSESFIKSVEFPKSLLYLEEKEGFLIPNFFDYPLLSEPGSPLLPNVPIYLLLPNKAINYEIKIIDYDYEIINLDKKIYPAQLPRPISEKKEIPFVPINEKVYNSEIYPQEIFKKLPLGIKSNFKIAPLILYPLQYLPKENKLKFYKKITLEITCETDEKEELFLTPSQYQTFLPEIEYLIFNKEDIKRFSPNIKSIQNEIDYLIITTDALIPYFNPFINWQKKKGLKVDIKSTAYIQNNYPGRDLQEKIRNFVIDNFNNRGLKYLLLAGDNAQVPARRCRVVVSGTTGDIPCDLYYGDLQWSWDGNGNNLFGEMGSDTVDLFADIYVGRVSCENSNEVNTFINKTLTYEKNPPTDYLNKVLLPSVMLWSNYPYHGRIVNESIANITPSFFTDVPLIDPSSYQMFDSLNRGYHYCHPAAHGDENGLYYENGTPIYSVSQASNQTNGNRLTIMNSIACYSGNFEYEDCLAEALMKNSNGGCVAVIMNSRYGWGTPPSMGPSEKLDVRFYDFLLLRDSIEIGKAHSRSKDYYQAIAQSDAVYRWCVYELNLFGNPSLPLWTNTPRNFLVQRPDTIRTGSQTLRIIVNSQGQPVSQAKVSVYKENEVFAYGFTNSSGICDLIINPITPGYLYLTVTKYNYLPKEESIVVILGTSQPHIVIHNIFIDDANQRNPNNQLDPGETVNIYIKVKNIGTANATNLSGLLRTQSNYLIILDSLSNYGNLAPNDTAVGDFYRIFALSQTPPGTVANFEIILNANEGNWRYNFDLQIGRPPQPRYVALNHDTGYCLLTVTALGSVGYTEPPSSDIGYGFRYPKNSPTSSLYYGSLMIGNSDNYVVDRFYGRPATSYNTDFRLVDSIEILPSPSGEQIYYCSFNDGNHPTPKGLKVYQKTIQTSLSGYNKFVIYLLTIKNEGSQPINNLYFGVIGDFDINPSSPTSDIAGSDTIRKYIYMRNANNENPTCGFKLLSSSPLANLFCVDHDRYVYPDTSLSEGSKFRMLNGTLRQWQSNRTYDWSILLSTGPYNLGVNEETRIAFAVVGGQSQQEFITNCDSAQSYYDNLLVVEEKTKEKILKEDYCHFIITKETKLKLKEKVVASLYDAFGRLIKVFNNEKEIELPKKNTGIYFLKIKNTNKSYRIVILK